MTRIVVIGTLTVLACVVSFIAAASAPEKKSIEPADDQTSAGGHHQSEWIPASGSLLTASGGAHSYVAGGQSYGHALPAGPSPSSYYNPYGYHAVHVAGPALSSANVHAQPIQYASAVQYGYGNGGGHGGGGHGGGGGGGELHSHSPSIEVAPLLQVAGYKPVLATGHEPLVHHQPKKVIHQHHEHQKVIHQHHIHQHVVHEHHLHKVHLHDLHLQDHNIHQHHKHIEHVHVPIYHTHKKHALKETEEHRTHQTHGESHEHAPPKIVETKSHAPPVYASKPVVHHAHGAAIVPSYGGAKAVVHASPAPLYYKSQPVQPWG